MDCLTLGLRKELQCMENKIFTDTRPHDKYFIDKLYVAQLSGIEHDRDRKEIRPTS